MVTQVAGKIFSLGWLMKAKFRRLKIIGFVLELPQDTIVKGSKIGKSSKTSHFHQSNVSEQKTRNIYSPGRLWEIIQNAKCSLLWVYQNNWKLSIHGSTQTKYYSENQGLKEPPHFPDRMPRSVYKYVPKNNLERSLPGNQRLLNLRKDPKRENGRKCEKFPYWIFL